MGRRRFSMHSSSARILLIVVLLAAEMESSLDKSLDSSWERRSWKGERLKVALLDAGWVVVGEG